MNDNRWLGIYDGFVFDNLDPLLIGRVRVGVPGLIEPCSDWALPVGSAGAGSDARGLWCIPTVGSNVSVMFVEGDPDQPRYFAGPWGAPKNEPHSPTFVRELSPSDAIQIAGIETKRWAIVFDDRAGQETLIVRDRLNPENSISIDGRQQTVRISGTVGVEIKSTGVVKIDALQVVINGRIVLPSGNPI
jgi:uncharacterized protein involved in type VI secretion and phage assembly